LQNLKVYIETSLQETPVSEKQDKEFSFDAVHSTSSDDFSGSKNPSGHHGSSSKGQTHAVLGAPSSRVPDLLKRKPGKKGGKSRKHKTKR
jgi:hypothetical protein